MPSLEQLFALNKIVPVVVINDLAAAIPLAETLLEAGINTVEITMRSKEALAVVSLLRSKVPQMVVGAGTICNVPDFANAYAAGANYIISPGVTHKLLDYAASRKEQVHYIPGVVTPSEALLCAEFGFKYLKFFPAEAYNAYAVLKALFGPLSALKFCPTGGITLENLGKYLQLPNIFALGMSSIVESKLIAEHDFVAIKALANAAVTIVNSNRA